MGRPAGVPALGNDADDAGRGVPEPGGRIPVEQNGKKIPRPARPRQSGLRLAGDRRLRAGKSAGPTVRQCPCADLASGACGALDV